MNDTTNIIFLDDRMDVSLVRLFELGELGGHTRIVHELHLADCRTLADVAACGSRQKLILRALVGRLTLRRLEAAMRKRGGWWTAD